MSTAEIEQLKTEIERSRIYALARCDERNVAWEKLDAIRKLIEPVVEIDGDTSDGYHTFDELYEFRMLYNAALFNEWAARGVYNVHKSLRHGDGGECFGGGWFIVMAQLPTGQISNHYKTDHWDLFTVPERAWADEWDGHTSADVASRLRDYLE